ncbi:carbohydrate-binding domain-containing protein [Denitromonas sp.]|uniref:carbohydrate-binding domain-containing protein n=1 Tax=Denitromonas sp. TaxID=2734609 RepID=UPI003A85FB30
MNNVSEMFSMASLAQASYAAIPPAATQSQLTAALRERDGGFSFTQAIQFAAQYSVVTQYNDADTSFSATVFKDGSGNLTLAIRGTLEKTGWPNDIVPTDADIFLRGMGYDQIVAMYNWWQRASVTSGNVPQYALIEYPNANVSTPPASALPLYTTSVAFGGTVLYLVREADAAATGELAGALSRDSDGMLDVTGHSLGGHLALAFASLFPSVSAKVATFNAPGFVDSAVNQSFMSRLGGAVPNGIAPAGIPTLNVVADEARVGNVPWSAIAALHSRPGLAVDIAIENQWQSDETSSPAALNHSQQTLTDALAVFSMLTRLDSTVTAAGFKTWLNAAVLDTAGSLERLVDSVEALLGIDGNAMLTGNENRDLLYQALNEMQRGGTKAAFEALEGKVTLTDLDGDPTADFSQFLALYHLTPFVLRPTDAAAEAALRGAHADLYSRWQAAMALPSEGREAFTEQWLADRTAMLGYAIKRNELDREYIAEGGRSTVTVFSDGVTGSEFSVLPPATSGNLNPSKNFIRFGGALADTLMGGEMSDRLYGGEGADVLSGGKGDDRLEGGEGADTLEGKAGNDTLFGDAGDDVLRGGAGADSLLGGAGNDRYEFTGEFGNDVVVDAAGANEIWIDNVKIAAFTADGNGASFYTSDDDRFQISHVDSGTGGSDLLITRTDGSSDSVTVQNWSSGLLGVSLTTPAVAPISPTLRGDIKKKIDVSVDVNGIVREHFAVAYDPLTGVPVGYVQDGDQANAPDMINGTLNADTILSLGGNDAVGGSYGDDYIDGGDGNDLLLGGEGADTIIGGSGMDFIFGSHMNVTAYSSSPNTVDYYSSFGFGGAPGKTWVYPGSDSVLHFGDNWGITNPLGVFEIWGPLSATTPLVHDGQPGELVYGFRPPFHTNDAAAFLDGGSGDDYIVGGDGRDTIIGGDDNDSMYGVGGADLMQGGLGNDLMIGDGVRYLDEYWAIGGVDGVDGHKNITDRMFSRTPVAVSNQGDDTLLGGDGADSMYGLGGNDRMFGGDGADIIDGDLPSVLISPQIPLIDLGRGNDWISGGDGADIIHGDFGDDTVFGGDGNDILNGDMNLLDAVWGAIGIAVAGLAAGHGNDWVDGGDGSDSIVGGYGADTLLGGTGDDVIRGGDNLVAAAAGLPDDDWLDGGAGNDDLAGESGNDTIFGGADNDVIWGQAGDDFLDGGSGKDSLYGDSPEDSAGDDVLFGGSDADELYGDNGNDILSGDAGADFMDGGDGDDTYLIARGDAVLVDGLSDTIEDSSGSDTLILSGVSSFEDVYSTSIDGDLYLGFGAGEEVIIVGGLSGTVVENFVDGSERAISFWQLINKTYGLSRSLTANTTGVTLPGGANDDTLRSSFANTQFMGGYGNDSIVATQGGNTFRFEFGDGVDTVSASGNHVDVGGQVQTNRLVLGAGIHEDMLKVAIVKDGWSSRAAIDLGQAGRIVLPNVNLADVLAIPTFDEIEFESTGSVRTWSDVFSGGFDVAATAPGGEYLSGSNLDDRLSSGSGNDTFVGGAGNDEYRVGWGGGADVVSDVSQQTTAGADVDTIRFGFDVAPDSVQVSRAGAGYNDLKLAFGGPGESVTLQGFFSNDSVVSTRWRFVLDDATEWSVAEVVRRAMAGTGGKDGIVGLAGDDVLAGLAGNDYLAGRGGNDSLDGGAGADNLSGDDGDDLLEGGADGDNLSGGAGDDTLIGGTGNDWLDGGAGDDEYRFGYGDGQDTLYEYDAAPGKLGVLRFADEVLPENVDLFRADNGLTLILQDASGDRTGDWIHLKNYFSSAGSIGRIDRIEFGNGPVWTYEDIKPRLLAATPGDDALTGFAEADAISGSGGNDVISGEAGDDTLSGGDGNDWLGGGVGADQLFGGDDADTLWGYDRVNLHETGNDVLSGGRGDDLVYGGKGSDVYLFDRGDGDDTIGDVLDAAGSDIDVLRLGAGIHPEDVSFYRGYTPFGGPPVDDLIIHISGGTDQITLNDFFGSGKESIERIEFDGGNGAIWGRAEILSAGVDAGAVDTQTGTSGDDVFFVDHEADVIIEAVAGGHDRVDSTRSYRLPENVEDLMLVGVLNSDAEGNGLDNLLVGNSGNNRLIGFEGFDTGIGGAGDDVYIGIGQVIEQQNGGVDTWIRGRVQSFSPLPDNVENLSLEIPFGSGFGSSYGPNWSVTAYGNDLDNILWSSGLGFSGDVLDGLSGADTMIALGFDSVVFHVDNVGDVVIASATGGSGDKVISAVDFELPDDVETLELSGSLGLRGSGNGLDNTLKGSAGGDTLLGGGGRDVLLGDSAGTSTSVAVNSLTVFARGRSAVGVAPTMEVWIEGVLAGTFAVSSSDYQPYSVAVSPGLQASQIEVVFTNDYYDPNAGEDRNLYVEKIVVGGREISSTAPGVVYDIGRDSGAFDGINLYSGWGGMSTNGALRFGLAGNDSLDGGIGADTMRGGVGNDVYRVDDAGDIVEELAGEGHDQVKTTVSYSLSQHVEDLHLLGTADIDATGNSENNNLLGNAGANRLDGGAGADYMVGYAGDDTYVVDATGDILYERPNEGVDTVESSISYRLKDHFERLELTGSADINGTGNGADNVIVGNAASNTLLGGDGDDELIGDSAGASTSVAVESLTVFARGRSAVGVAPTMEIWIEGVLAGTFAVLSSDYQPYSVAVSPGLQASQIDVVFTNDYFDPNAGEDRNLYVEKIVVGGHEISSTAAGVLYDYGPGGGAFDGLNLYSSSGWLTGAGAMRFSLAGSDSLDGGSGADTMRGGIGNDVYRVDDAGDVVEELADEGHDQVKSTVSYSLSQHIEDLHLLGTADIDATGNEGNNNLLGNAGANRLDGGVGGDFMAGFAGDDTYVVDSLGDVLYERPDEGVDTVESSISYRLKDHFERLELTGRSDINGTGNGADNVIVGNNGSNVLTGSGGDDRLFGGGGADVYRFGRGDGQDWIEDSDSTSGVIDRLEFGSGVSADQLWFRQIGNDLETSVIGTADVVFIKDWFSGTASHVEQIKTYDGMTLLDSQVENLVSAMAAFAPPGAGQTTLPQNYQEALSGVIAANWQ